ncbi:MAG: hypothetical protein FWB91_12115 [Defluviitaleaceae bacterium]|nr:hypothetical protein [Defluviitaleaceae bacterium]
MICLFSKIGAIGVKVLSGAAFVKAAPFVLPVACAAVCVGVTIAGAKHMSKMLLAKALVDASLHQCDFFDDEYADEDNLSDDKDINEDE